MAELSNDRWVKPKRHHPIVIPLPQRRRYWRIVEVQPDLWRAGLFEVPDRLLYATAPARLSRISRFLRHAGGGYRLQFEPLEVRR